MDSEEQQQIIHKMGMEITERVTKVEVRMDSISTLLTTQADALKAVSERQNNLELSAVAIRERTEQHANHIQHLQEESVDVGKLLAAMKVQMDFWGNSWKFILTTVGGLIIGYIFSHLIH